MACSARRFNATGGQLVRTIIDTLREAFEETGWSEATLAQRAGTSQATVCRILHGDPSAMRVVTVGALADALGVRMRIAADLPYRVGRPAQNDRVHAPACGYVGRRLAERGWAVRQEVEVGQRTVRGWIDTLGYREDDGALFVSEFKSELRDAGAVQRTIGWYEREAWDAARALGWRPRVIGSAVLLLASEANDEAVRANRQFLAQACPTRASELAHWLEQPSGQPLRRGLAMIDPLSRRRQWLRPTRTDGRRSAAPWVGYADCAQAIATGRRSVRKPS